MTSMEVKVPDIGDFKDIPVIEVFVKPGDTVKAEDSLVTLESDKATMDVPSPAAGVVKELKVKLGDKVSEGSVIVVLDSAAAVATTGDAKPAAAPAPAAVAGPAAAPAAAPAAPTAIPGAATYGGKADVECEMLVLGAGPGGYSAAFRAADLGMQTVLDETKAFAEHGITFGAPKVDLEKLLAWKNKVVGKLTGGLSGMAKARKVDVVRGYGVFLDPHHVLVELTEGSGQGKTGGNKVVKFRKAIIAAGSQSVRLPFLPDDPRVVDSTGALLLRSAPKRMLIIGGGIIGTSWKCSTA